MSPDLQAVTLDGRHVRLEPLAEKHAQGLIIVGQQQEDWRYMPRTCFVDLPDCKHWIAESLATPGHLPFAIVEQGRDRPVGSSRYLAFRPEHRSLEIGWTWLGRDWQKTPVNTEAKLLLLQHAFEALGMIRVEFKTDARNGRSQRALMRIGAEREGLLRQHMIVQDGYRRDSVYFSITDGDWPDVKAQLRNRLKRG
ncbi:MAG: GNAT family protein [Halieaceae bacterium]